MTFSEILKDIFYRDRKKIYIYLACLIAVSFILFGSFIVRGEEVVGEDAATVVGGTMFSAVLILGNTMGSAIDPISILFVEGIIGLIIHFSEGSFLAPFQGKLGILENPAISIFFIVVFILVKCAKIIAPKLSMSAQEFEKIVDDLANDIPLDQKYRDHKLVNQKGNVRECHVAPDWLLIYSKDDEGLKLILTLLMTPFFKRMTRFAIFAISTLWVTIMTVFFSLLNVRTSAIMKPAD